MFKDRDVICFLGDSITAADLWMSEVYQTLRKRIKVKCYNCGVPGGVAKKANGYLYEECLVYNPDYVVLMFGMNDLRLDLHAASIPYSEECEELKKKWLNIHLEHYEEIINKCMAHGAEVIICTPTPYDEINDLIGEKFLYQCALSKARECHIKLAEKYGCRVVDFQSVMLELLKTKKLIGDDRVHPTPEGHHVMAQIFLKEIGEIDECDFDSTFEFEEWNKERHEWVDKLRIINYVQLCDLYDGYYAENKTIEETKKKAMEKYEAAEDKTLFIPCAHKFFADNADIKEKIRGEVIKRTIY